MIKLEARNIDIKKNDDLNALEVKYEIWRTDLENDVSILLDDENKPSKILQYVSYESIEDYKDFGYITDQAQEYAIEDAINARLQTESNSLEVKPKISFQLNNKVKKVELDKDLSKKRDIDKKLKKDFEKILENENLQEAETLIKDAKLLFGKDDNRVKNAQKKLIEHNKKKVNAVGVEVS